MPRLGLATIDISTLGGTGQDVVTTIDDFFFESNASGEVNPMLTTSRTNLIPYSENLATNWTSHGSTSSSDNAGTSPAGTNNATLVQKNGQAYARIEFNNFGTTLSSNTYTFSIFAKKGDTDFIKIRTDGGSVNEVSFNLNNGTVGSLVHASVINHSIEDAGNGWYRCSITAVNNITIVRVYVSDVDAVYSNTNNASAFFWGAQLEQDGFISAYIPTSGSTVTVSTTLNDTSEVWDFDSTDIMLEADPEDEGFWEEGSNLVLNHNYEELGSELITNGDFSNGSTGWNTIGGGITITDKANFNTVDNESLAQDGVLTNGKTYKVVFDILSVDSGNISVWASVNGYIQTFTTTGTKEVYFTYEGTDGQIRFRGTFGTGFVGSIDNVSVKQVDPNDRWTLGTGWSIEDGKLVGTSVSTQFAQQSLTLTSGTSYEVTFSITGADTLLNNNSFRYPYDGAVSNINYLPKDSPDGTYTNVFTSTGSSILYLGYIDAGTFTGTIDNVTVREYAVQPKDI